MTKESQPAADSSVSSNELPGKTLRPLMKSGLPSQLEVSTVVSIFVKASTLTVSNESQPLLAVKSKLSVFPAAIDKPLTMMLFPAQAKVSISAVICSTIFTSISTILALLQKSVTVNE